MLGFFTYGMLLRVPRGSREALSCFVYICSRHGIQPKSSCLSRGRIRCVEMGMLAVKLQTRFAISIVTCTPRPADDDPMLSVVCVAYFDLLYRLYLCYGMYYDTLLYSP